MKIEFTIGDLIFWVGVIVSLGFLLAIFMRAAADMSPMGAPLLVLIYVLLAFAACYRGGKKGKAGPWE
jgi:hypothetical protein